MMLSVRGLKVVRGGKEVVHGVDLEVGAGEIVALLGRNGAGKSSIVLALAGAIPRQGGEVLLGGKPIDGQSADAARRAGLAIVPEGHHVLGSLSVLDNLRAAAMVLPAAQAPGAITDALRIFPELEARLTAAGSALSGGQKQMVSMAQALIARPRLLVVDELSLGLAPLVVRRLADVVQAAAAKGVAVLLIEQFTTLALSLAARAYLLRQGHVAWSGEASTLRDQPEILAGNYLG